MGLFSGRYHFFSILPFLFVLTAPLNLHAHADIHIRLAVVTKKIVANPEDPKLYLERAEVHREHRDWPAALADYHQVERLAPKYRLELDLYRGRMWLEAGRPDKAHVLLDRYLAAYPDHVQALVIRGHAAVELGKPLAAAQDLSDAIRHAEKPTPELYLERARALVSAGPDYLGQALRGVDEGLKRLGPVIALIQFTVDTEQTRGHYSAALARLESLPVQVRSLPKWIARRGDILSAAGRVNLAQAAYTEALSAIEALPSRRRYVKAVAELEAKLRHQLIQMAD